MPKEIKRAAAPGAAVHKSRGRKSRGFDKTPPRTTAVCAPKPGAAEVRRCKIKIYGATLRRGYWLYICDVGEYDGRKLCRKFLYVGRTGGFKNSRASSLWDRLGFHLSIREGGEGATVLHHARNAHLDPESCYFEITGFGPFFDETTDPHEHRKIVSEMDGLETALAAELRDRGYLVEGKHSKTAATKPDALQRIVEALGTYLPPLRPG